MEPGLSTVYTWPCLLQTCAEETVRIPEESMSSLPVLSLPQGSPFFHICNRSAVCVVLLTGNPSHSAHKAVINTGLLGALSHIPELQTPKGEVEARPYQYTLPSVSELRSMGCRQPRIAMG